MIGRLRVAVPYLGDIICLMTPAVRVVGSDVSSFAGEVILLLDVSQTGLPGGEWKAEVRDTLTSRTLELSPVALIGRS